MTPFDGWAQIECRPRRNLYVFCNKNGRPEILRNNAGEPKRYFVVAYFIVPPRPIKERCVRNRNFFYREIVYKSANPTIEFDFLISAFFCSFMVFIT